MADIIVPKDPTEQLYGELRFIHEYFNESLWEGILYPCIFTTQRVKNVYGYFSAKRFANPKIGAMADEIAVNPSYFAIRDIRETLSTMVHEQVHQWQIHNGKPGRRGYHNMEFARAMENLGLLPISVDRGRRGSKIGDRVDHKIIPGGPFEIACSKLLESGFTLSWFDRYPPLEDLNRLKETVSDEILEVISTSNDPDSPPGKKQKPKPSYRCANCNATVWGKPGLSLICGACTEHMQEES